MLRGPPRCDLLRARTFRPHLVKTALRACTRHFAGVRAEDSLDGRGASLWQERCSVCDRKRPGASPAAPVTLPVSVDNSSCPRHASRSSPGIPFARKAARSVDNSRRQEWSRTMAGRMAVRPAQKSQPEAHAGAEAARTAVPEAALAMAAKEHPATHEREGA